MAIEYAKAQLIYSQHAARGWFVAHNLCRLARIGAVVTFLIFAIQSIHHQTLDWQAGCIIGGLGLGIYLFHKGKQKAQENTRKNQRHVELFQFFLTGKITEHHSRFIRILKKIDKAIYSYWRSFTLFCPNRAQRGVISKCLDNVIQPELATFAIKHGVLVSPLVRLDPAGRGVCLGSCLHFARLYLKSKNIHATMNAFHGGAPYEAVLLHGQLKNLCIESCPEHLLSSLDDTQEKINAEWAGLAVRSSAFSIRPPEVQERLTNAEDGAYRLSFSKKGGNGHSILLIKEGSTYFVFDPNENELVQKGNAFEAVKFIEKTYDLQDDIQHMNFIELTLPEPPSAST